jgi:hypothetical protein
MVEEDNSICQLRMAHVDDVVLLDKPADLRSPRWIDCYVVEVENFAGGDSKKFKLNPERILFSLQYQHNGYRPTSTSCCWASRSDGLMRSQLCCFGN